MEMSNILIDTNIYSNALRGDEIVSFTLKKATLIGISTICIGELLSGFKGGKKEKCNRDELDQFPKGGSLCNRF